ncbi:MAG: hypothetical protein ACK4WF_07150, partial [Candidatus Brocadiales bacterium]
KEYAKRSPVSAIKSMTGDCLDASGAMQCVACIGAINKGIIPPTINYQEPDPSCDLDVVPNVKREAMVRHAVVQSFSYTGNCSAVVLSKCS